MWRTQRTCPVGLASTSAVHSTRLGWTIRLHINSRQVPLFHCLRLIAMNACSRINLINTRGVLRLSSAVVCYCKGICKAKFNLVRTRELEHFCRPAVTLCRIAIIPQHEIPVNECKLVNERCTAAEITALNNAQGTEDGMVSSSSLICSKRKTWKRFDQKRRNNEDIQKIVNFIPMWCQGWVG